MNSKLRRIVAGIESVKEIVRRLTPPPVRLLMSDGTKEQVQPEVGEHPLDFLFRLANNPLSSEAELICSAVAFLEQPGHLMEVARGFVQHRRDILDGTITPELVQLGLCTREQCCGMEPQSAAEFARKVEAFYSSVQSG